MLRSKKITIKENSYELKFPTVGQLIDIEILKSSLSKGNYSNLLSNANVFSLAALDMIDAEAYLTVLIGKELKKHLNIDSFSELSLEDGNIVRKVYKEQVLPFVEEILKVINTKEESEDQKDA